MTDAQDAQQAPSAGRASFRRQYFEDMYAKDPDPWNFRTSGYERRKYRNTIRALGDRRFERGVEIGCSIGELTARLAPRCRSLLGVDISQQAVDAARQRNAEFPHVSIARMTLPGEAPAGMFDLIVLSEVLYYFGDADLERLAAWVVQARPVGGMVLLVHWLGDTGDYPMDGDEAVTRFLDAVDGSMTLERGVRRHRYRLDRLG
jgi:predicted TPR repeat methyltransferase